MNLIFLSGRFLNLDNVTAIQENGKELVVEYLNGLRDSLAANSPEARALRWWLGTKATNIEKRFEEEQEREAKAKAQEDWFYEFDSFVGRNRIKDHTYYRMYLQNNAAPENWRQPNDETYADFLVDQEKQRVAFMLDPMPDIPF